MRRAVRDPRQLCQLLGLPEEVAVEAAESAAESRFPLFVPRPYLERIRPGDRDDPLLLQVLPRRQELDAAPGYSSDPVGDLAARATASLLHKYHGRALMVVTGACAVHCRYCFRRHFPYQDGAEDRQSNWRQALEHLARDPEIHEVLLSGGDPLTLDDRALGDLAGQLSEIPHLRRLRIHTRLPIMIPSRVTPELISWLRGGRLTPIVVIHANHPAELDRAALAAIASLVDAGVVLLNQSVLLRGVNDNLEVLCELSERLVDHRVMPYYLHLLDRVQGAAHFEADDRGPQLIRQMQSRLPGYAVPRLVREVAGERHKQAV